MKEVSSTSWCTMIGCIMWRSFYRGGADVALIGDWLQIA
jgi:hypothetical protein